MQQSITLAVMQQSIIFFSLITLQKLTLYVIAYLLAKQGQELMKLGITGSLQIDGEDEKKKLSLKTDKPGIAFVILGVVLAVYAVSVDKQVITVYPDTVAKMIDAAPPDAALPDDEGKQK